MVSQTITLLAFLLLTSTAALAVDPVPTHQVVVDASGNPTTTLNLSGSHVTGLTPAIQTASGATINPTLAPGKSTLLNCGVLTTAATVSAPTGTPVDGQTLTFRFTQDGTGGRIITWNAVYAFPAANPASSLPTGANNKYEIVFGYCASDAKWRARGVAGPY